MSKILAYRVSAQKNELLSADILIRIHEWHAENHDGKVLFTIAKKTPSAQSMKDIDEIIITTSNGYCAIHANVVASGHYPNDIPPKGYTLPSIWSQEEEEQEEERGWFAINNIEHIESELSDYYNDNSRKPLLSTFGANSISYVSKW